MIRKFKVEVTRVDEFIVSIDDEKIDDDFVKEYEENFHGLGSDKIKGMASALGQMAPDNGSFFEGFGNIKMDGYEGYSCIDGIEIDTVLVEDIEAETDEIFE